MKTVRQDAWTPEDDQVLVEVILRHIRTSSTQLAAFEEASTKLGRTRAACGFRWNAVLRKEYTAQLEIAKAERRANRDVQPRPDLSMEIGALADTTVASTAEEDLTWFRVLKFLKSRRDEDATLRTQVQHMERLKRENHTLQAENLRLESELSVIKGDYLALVQIMERARKQVLQPDPPAEERPMQTFKMDENGNLERLE